jgi:hypothetical protein
MKIKLFTKASVIAISLLFMGTSLVLAWDSMETICPWESGDAYAEVGQIGDYDYAYKWNEYGEVDPDVDEGAPEGTYTVEFYDDDGNLTHSNTITIENVTLDEDDEALYFDWNATSPIDIVIVYGATCANIFYYDEPAYSDSGLYAPLKDNGEPYAVSHISFGWNPDDQEEWCEETAWAGDSVGGGSAWWFYYNASVGGVQTIWAGQTMEAGTVEVVNGTVYLLLNATEPWILQDVEEPVKIQGYEEDELPDARPDAGGFDYKGDQLTVYIGDYDYYAIHLDAQHPCDPEDPPDDPLWYRIFQKIIERFPNAFPLLQLLVNYYRGC